MEQYTFAEFPFADWHLRPTGKNQSRLLIRGKLNEIVIEIGEGYVKLLSPTTDYIDVMVKNRKMPPSLLLKKLSLVGLNFMGPRGIKGWDIEDFVLKVWTSSFEVRFKRFTHVS